MDIKNLLNSTILAAALTLGIAEAHAETSFGTLAGVQADPMSADEMEATQGRFFYDPISGNLADVFGNIFAYDPETGTYSDPNGKPWTLAYLGDPNEPYVQGLDFLMDDTAQSGIVGFNMFGTQLLADGSIVDVFGTVVGSWGPGS